MKKFAAVLLLAVCLSCGSAWAASITPDVVTTFYLNGSTTAVASPYLQYGSSVTYSHNILDNGFSIGDTLTSVSITFSINDNDIEGRDDRYKVISLTCDYTEYVSLIADGFETTFEMSDGSTKDLDLPLVQLQANGVLNVTLSPIASIYSQNSNWISDFYLFSSTLTVEYIDNTPDNNSGNTSVPEPASLLLLGLGLMGLAGAGRKFRK